MNRKLPITFISMLMLLSLVCVGFAAWCIDDSLVIPTSVTGSFDVDNIISGGDTEYLSTTATAFEYYDNTFLTIEKNGEIVTSVTQSETGYITIDVTVNKAKLPSLINPTFKISLTQNNKTTDTNETIPNILTSTYVKNIYVNEINEANKLTSINYLDYEISSSYKAAADTNSLVENYSFIIEFNVSKDDTVFFNTLFNQKISFSYSITIEGEENA